MAVTGNLNSLKNMPVQMMAMKMLKKAGIVTIGICGSKITGGTFLMSMEMTLYLLKTQKVKIYYSPGRE